MEELITIGMIMCYGLVGGIVSRILGDPYIKRGESPWDNPGPFIGGIFWPIAVPTVVGFRLAARYSFEGRNDRRRNEALKDIKQELELAKSRMELAHVRAAEAEAIDRQLGLDRSKLT